MRLVLIVMTNTHSKTHVCLFMLAIDDFEELKLRYGEDAANQAHIFMMKQVV